MLPFWDRNGRSQSAYLLRQMRNWFLLFNWARTPSDYKSYESMFCNMNLFSNIELDGMRQLFSHVLEVTPPNSSAKLQNLLDIFRKKFTDPRNNILITFCCLYITNINSLIWWYWWRSSPYTTKYKMGWNINIPSFSLSFLTTLLKLTHMMALVQIPAYT